MCVRVSKTDISLALLQSKEGDTRRPPVISQRSQKKPMGAEKYFCESVDTGCGNGHTPNRQHDKPKLTERGFNYVRYF
nr:MAG TPA: hypothetical protein [Caudoviricetes sp.]